MGEVRNGSEVYRLMVDSISDCAIFMLDADGCVATWNAGAERIEGYRPAEIVGRHFSVFYSREDARSRKPERDLASAAAQGQIEDESWRVSCVASSPTWRLR